MVTPSLRSLRDSLFLTLVTKEPEQQGFDVWKSVVRGYTTTKKQKTTTKKEFKRNNKIAMYFILEELPNPIREKVGKCSLAKKFGIRFIISTLRSLPSQR